VDLKVTEFFIIFKLAEKPVFQPLFPDLPAAKSAFFFKVCFHCAESFKPLID